MSQKGEEESGEAEEMEEEGGGGKKEEEEEGERGRIKITTTISLNSSQILQQIWLYYMMPHSKTESAHKLYLIN